MKNLIAHDLNSPKYISPHIKNLHAKALQTAAKFKSSEIELIETFQQLDRFKVYYKYQYFSLFDYAKNYMQLSPNAAAMYINVARKSQQVPALKQQIKAGTITISKAIRLTAVLNEKNQDHWLELAKNSSKQQLERAIALAKPGTAEKIKFVALDSNTDERVKFAVRPSHAAKNVGAVARDGQTLESKNLGEEFAPAGNSVRVQLQLSMEESSFEKFKAVQKIIAQKKRSMPSMEETLSEMVELYLEKNCPLRKAERAAKRTTKNLQHCPGNVTLAIESKKEMVGETNAKKATLGKNRKKRTIPAGVKERTTSVGIKRRTFPAGVKRQKIPAEVKRQVVVSNGNRCSYTSKDGLKCKNQNFLEVHHKVPVSKGGRNTPENLELLCYGHHRMLHNK